MEQNLNAVILRRYRPGFNQRHITAISALGDNNQSISSGILEGVSVFWFLYANRDFTWDCERVRRLWSIWIRNTNVLEQSGAAAGNLVFSQWLLCCVHMTDHVNQCPVCLELVASHGVICWYGATISAALCQRLMCITSQNARAIAVAWSKKRT